MKSELNFSGWVALLLVLIVACAAGTRIGYLAICTEYGEKEAALRVQGDAEKDHLIANIHAHHWFYGQAPLADNEETTAHVAPGYYWLFGAVVEEYFLAPDQVWRWLNVVLGSLTAGIYFLFARRAFHCMVIATLTGLLTACYPFWIINTAELNDGVLATFLLSLCLLLGAYGSQTGGTLTGLLFGVALAGLVLVRAALLPFAVIALVWYLWECRRYAVGWCAGLLALLGLANGVLLWGLRNHQEFEQPIPIANSTYLHLWMGNNPHATGSTMDEFALRHSLKDQRLPQVLQEANQAKRYQLLAGDVFDEIRDHPVETMSRRLKAFEIFALGEYWNRHGQLCVLGQGDTLAEPPSWLTDNVEVILHGTLLGMFVLSLLGWRWSHSWRAESRIAAISLVWIPLPYVLSHAEPLLGPRLPLDGVLLCYAAFALLSLIPGMTCTPNSDTKSPAG